MTRRWWTSSRRPTQVTRTGPVPPRRPLARLCSACRTEIFGRFNYCLTGGMQPNRGPPIPRDPAVSTRTAGLVRSVLYSACRTEIFGRFNYCLTCDMQPNRGPPIPRDPAVSTRTAGLVRSVLYSACRTEIFGRLNYCLTCAMQPNQGSPIPRDRSVSTFDRHQQISTPAERQLGLR